MHDWTFMSCLRLQILLEAARKQPRRPICKECIVDGQVRIELVATGISPKPDANGFEDVAHGDPSAQSAVREPDGEADASTFYSNASSSCTD